MNIYGSASALFQKDGEERGHRCPPCSACFHRNLFAERNEVFG